MDELSQYTIGELIFFAKRLVQDGENAKNSPVTLTESLCIIRNRSTGQDFEEYCREIGMSPRMAYYLIKIDRRLRANDVQLPSDVSWRKLAEVTSILTWENAEEIFEYCRTHTRENIKEWVKQQKGG